MDLQGEKIFGAHLPNPGIVVAGGQRKPSPVAEDVCQVKEPTEPVDVSDVYGLLAAITMIEARDRGVLKDPARNIGEQKWSPFSVSEMLDALSALLISDPEREVLSTTLRVHSGSIECIVADDGDVSDSAATHLHWIWCSLKEISSRHHALYSKGTREDTVVCEAEDGILRSRVSALRYGCAKFSFSVVQKRVNKKIHSFRNTFEEVFKRKNEHPFLPVLESILELNRLFTREQGAVLGRPAEEDTENWGLFVDLVRQCQLNIQEFFGKGGFAPDELRYTDRFVKWKSYLCKIASIMGDVDSLVDVATSLEHQQLFTLEFNSTILPKMATRIPSVPESVGDWRKVLEKAVSQYNSEEKSASDKRRIAMPTVNEDIAYMAGRMVSKDLAIHCEVKIVFHLAATGFQGHCTGNTGTNSYIGSSKPACRGCYAFIQAFNEIHRTRFLTKKTKAKSYWPWQLPEDFPRSQETTVVMYKILSKYWANGYRGYVRDETPC